MTPALFIANSNMGFASFSNPNFSQYQGLFLKRNTELFKSIENIYFSKSYKLNKLDVAKFERIHAKNVFEKFEFLDSKTLKYETNYRDFINIDLDFRFIHDFCDKGRIYEIEKFDGGIKIIYKKYEDNSLKNLLYTYELIVKGDFEYVYNERWTEKFYSYDNSRKTKSNFFVNTGLKIKVKSEVIFQEKSDFKFMQVKKEALSSVKNEEGIIAGLPWFYQYWARDELISLKYFILNKDYDFSKKIIFRHLNRIDTKGLVKNRYPESSLGSIDASGLLFLRCFELLKLNVLSNDEIKIIKSKVKYVLEKLNENRVENNFLKSYGMETWMDTHIDPRSGFRIEIQALYFQIIKCYNILFEDFKYDENKFKKLFNKHFVKDGFLIDGYENNEIDYKIRPNIFLAYYYCKELVNKRIWKNSFDRVLANCWLDWGGFSSISKNNFLFKKEHSGITNESYHNGDSWFFINNIAGICMLDLDSKKYSKYINKIFEASKYEKDNLGFIGVCAEISNANNLSSKGCLCQAWSEATLLEFSKAIKNKRY